MGLPTPTPGEPDARRAVLRYAGVVVADTRDLVRVLETSHPPTFYLPRAAFVPVPAAGGPHDLLRVEGRGPLRRHRGAGRARAAGVGWWYPEPDRRYPQLRDRVAVYAGPVDEITLDGELVRPQPGGFYGGWITDDVVGPVKGGPGTWGW